MSGYSSILIILFVELFIFIGEILLASVNKKNKALIKKKSSEKGGDIILFNGFRTNISVFRFSLLLVYVVLIVLFFNSNSENLVEELILYVLGGILIYMVSIMNSKVFVFYDTYFVVSSPFNFFRKELIIDYDTIDEFHIYKALYNAFYLKLDLKDKSTKYIHFSGSYLPKNDLALSVILGIKTKFDPQASQ